MLKLYLKCPYNCGWEGIFSDIEAHFKSCPLKEDECKYHKIGCGFVGKKNECEEHEKNNVSLHLQMAFDYIKRNPIISQKNKIQFDQNCVCKVSCHEHALTYISKEGNWICNGSDMEDG